MVDFVDNGPRQQCAVGKKYPYFYATRPSKNNYVPVTHSTAILFWTYRAELTNDPSFRVNPKMNDSEAACFGAEALEYHCSVCNFVRLAVRPVNGDFDIFIRILFYLN